MTAGTVKQPSPTVRALARTVYPTSKGFQGAFIKGWYAKLAGRSRDDCPYHGRYLRRGGGTFSFAWRNAWLGGFDARERRETAGRFRTKAAR